MSYLKKLKYYLRYILIPDDKYIKYKFKKRFGYELNLNNPKTFSEKIQWLKVHDRTPLHTQCADKFKVRDYVKEKIGEEYLIPLIFETKNIYQINLKNLPEFPVVVKVNHSRGVFLIKDKNKFNFQRMYKVLKKDLNDNFYYRTREWQYKNIQPRVIIEKMLLTSNNKIPLDYKFHCINGKVELIQVDLDRFEEHTRNIYSSDWEQLDIELDFKNGEKINKPKNLIEMIKIAEKLSENFVFARIDLYNIDGEIYFGEITFHPGSGFEKFRPAHIDLELGKKITLTNIEIKSN